jgi:hypothetical protein
VVTNASGRQYRVVAVDAVEAAEFADPPRKWGRVGIMAGGWALVLALGAWIAPGFAASGSAQNEDPRDEPATSESNAAWRYLRYGSDEDLDRAEATLCEDASPEVTPSDLDAIRQSYEDALGGITRIDLETQDPVALAEGSSVVGRVSYIYEGSQRHEEFQVTVQEGDGAFCVSDAVQMQSEGETPSTGDGSEPAVDLEVLATTFLTHVVGNRDPLTAATSQCDSYTGITPEELDQAIADWAAQNDMTTGFVSVDLADSPESSVTMFDAEVSLQGDLRQDTFAFQVGVQGDCVTSLEGGDGLMDSSGD